MKVFRSFYFSQPFFFAAWVIIGFFVLGYFIPVCMAIGKILLMLLTSLLVIDIIGLYRISKGINARRSTTDKWSNGDQNPVSIYIENFYPFQTSIKVIDELPIQFQDRNSNFKLKVSSLSLKRIDYKVRPTQRGSYVYGALNVFVASPLHLIYRRYQLDQEKTIPVYPSFIQMRKYELLAISNKLTMAGIKKIRKIAQAVEFDQIKDYVAGDDYRTINWKATARRQKPMVNQYQDEKSQNVYSLIDMGRVMKMPFEGLSLLDYAINASLIISNIAMHKEDKAGMITFSNEVQTILKAEKKKTQLHKILDLLHAQKTNYMETDFERLYIAVKRNIKQRSLLLLYTNFESVLSLSRQMPYFRKLAKSHILVIIIFENTELKTLLNSEPKKTDQIYIKTIAEKYAFEKRLIIKELERYGIYSILTPPKDLNVSVINKYLELKARGIM